MSNYNPEELVRLVDSSSDGRCDKAERDQLEGLLQENPDAVDVFVRYRDMLGSLRWLTAPKDAGDNGADAKRIEKALRSSRSDGLWQQIHRFGGLMLAASLLFAIVGFWVGMQWEPSHTSADNSGLAAMPSSDLPSTTNPQGEVARITGLVDCNWQDGQRRYQFGDLVASGECVELEDGLLQLTFDSGAKVIIQGPATFTPQSAMEAQLERGKISAVISESARGYTVVTPTAEIVDLGTEFAVDVASDGATELHVLDGDVVARRRSVGGSQEEVIHARKLDALRFASLEADVEKISAKPDKFARQITPKLSSEELPGLPVTEDLKFWVAADLLVSRDANGAVSAWRDVCIGDNQVSNDACQFNYDQQPLWIADTGYGQPGIRFNGLSTNLKTDAFSTGDQVSVLVACTPSKSGQRNTRQGGHLVNFGGFAPTIEVAVRRDNRVYAGLWAANAFGEEINSGAAYNQTVPAGSPCILCYKYDVSLDRAELWVNGSLDGPKSAPLSAKTTSSRTIGSHGDELGHGGFFLGDIHEVLIYDAALSDADRVAVLEYLRQRYPSH